MKKLTFNHGKQYGTQTGCIITMKALITITTPEYSEQLVECYEDKTRYKPDDLIEISQSENRYRINMLSL
ncbi:MAG: hypothetical protein VB046_09600 [Paludibacter sp.]|nr:hypothetical protein [Paludibacter sp.]